MKKIIFFFFFVFILCACAPFIKSEQLAHKDFLNLENGDQIGQTFLSHYDGLQGISLYLDSEQQSTGEIRLNLYNHPGDTQPLRTASIPLIDLKEPGFNNFKFDAIKYSNDKDYYLSLLFDGEGNLLVGVAPGNAYLNGSLYIENQPVNSQVSFQLEHSPNNYLVGLLIEGLKWLGVLAAGLFLLAVPGWAALSWLFPPWKSLNWIGKLALAIGVGVAFYPVLFLWTDVINLHLSTLYAWILPSIGSILIVWKVVRDRKDHASSVSSLSENPDDTDKAPGIDWWLLIRRILPDLTFLLVMGIIIFTRFWPIRSLDAPMWGDSYQHSIISQLLVDNNGLFKSWRPYTELLSFTYHFGFHSIIAAYHWLSGMEQPQATLWMGQVLNIFAVMALYPLAMKVGKNRWAGILAVFIAGLVVPMPMNYVNWGRYTQLAAQIVLPAVVVIIWLNLESKPVSWKWNILLWLVISGLSITHYRVLIFLPLFYISFLILRFRNIGWINILKRTFIHALGAIVLILPWVFRTFEGKLPLIYGQQVTTPAAQVSQSVQELNTIANLPGYLPVIVWGLMLVSVLWGILQRNKNSIIFSFWWLLIILAANPQWFRLPGEGVLSNFAVLIAFYIPAGVLIGSAAGDLIPINFPGKINQTQDKHQPEIQEESRISDKLNLIWMGGVFLLILGISLWSTRTRIRDVQPADHALVTRPDINAATWIIEHLPDDSKLLVNSFFAYGNSLVVGSDAGWWLPLLADRQTTLPPINYAFENGPRPDFVTFINELVSEIEEKGIGHPDVLKELKNRDVTHVYIGQQQGKVNTQSPPLLKARDLIDDPNYRLVYNHDRVKIFEIVNPEGCFEDSRSC